MTQQSEDLHQQISCSLKRSGPLNSYYTLPCLEGIQGELHQSGQAKGLHNMHPQGQTQKRTECMSQSWGFYVAHALAPDVCSGCHLLFKILFENGNILTYLFFYLGMGFNHFISMQKEHKVQRTNVFNRTNRPICATRAALQLVSAQWQAGWCLLGPAGAQSCSGQSPQWQWQTDRDPSHPANTPKEAEHGDLGWLLPLRRGDRWQVGRAQLRVCVSITPKRAREERERRSDRSSVNTPFICESGVDVSHHQHVSNGCLSSLGNGNLWFRF